MARTSEYEKVQIILRTVNTAAKNHKDLVTISVKTENHEFRVMIEEFAKGVAQVVPQSKKIQFDLNAANIKAIDNYCQSKIAYIRENLL